MKKIVVDASVCLKWIFEEKDSDKARNILSLSDDGKLLLLAPSIWEYEIINGFSSALLKKKITFSQAKRLSRMIIAAKPQIISIEDLLPNILENCHLYKISAYDSAYVTLARENKLTLISADEKLVQKVANKDVIGLTQFEAC